VKTGPVSTTARSRPQLTVRLALGLVLATALALGFHVNRARIRREAVSHLKRAGVAVVYDYECADGEILPSPEPPARLKWLVGLLGADLVGTVVAVHVLPGGSEFELADLAKLEGIERLDLSGSAVTDAGLSNLKGLRRLTTLQLSGTKITTAGLASIRHLGRLIKLDISGTDAGDIGLNQLNKLANLEELRLRGTHLTDAGIASLGSLAALRALDVGDTSVADGNLP